MELRSRSRSNTPLIRSSMEKEVYEEDGRHVETLIRTTRSTTIRSSENSKSKTTTPTLKSKERSVRKKIVTSDYSSEDGDYEVSSSKDVSQNTKNQFMEEAKRNVNGKSEISALNVYKQAGEYWNKYPKTDYTYSRHSRDRVELAPGVVAMPNMSRRSLHTYEGTEHLTSNKHTSTDSYFEDSVDYAHSKTNNIKVVPRALFSNNNYDETLAYSSSSFTLSRKLTAVLISVYTTIFSLFHFVYSKQSSWIVWAARWLHTTVSRVMLLDSWILRTGRHHKKVSSLLMLCLVPLLIFGGWWLLSGASQLMLGVFYSASTKAVDSEGSALGEVKVTIDESPRTVLASTIEIVHETNPKGSFEIDTDVVIEKLLATSQIQNILKNYDNINGILESKYEHADENRQQVIIDNLREEVNSIRLEMQQLENARKEDLSNVLAQLRSESNQANVRITQQLNRCCRRSFIEIERHVLQILKDLFAMPVATPKDASLWLRSLFVAKEDLERQMANLTQHLRSEFDGLVASNGKQIMDDVALRITRELHKNHRFDDKSVESSSEQIVIDSLTDEHIKKIVLGALAVYDADKTGLVDYAMEPSGGQILSTRCTETYQAGTAVVSILGVPLWYASNSPRTVITPGVSPGECWAFQNFPGFLIIKLAGPVKVEMFSYEHISRKLVANGKIDSAPKEFAVFGLHDEKDKEPFEIGQYVYDYEGGPLQYFPAGINNSLVFNIIELRIYSNHGNPNYTCLYRFRVHGTANPAEPT